MPESLAQPEAAPLPAALIDRIVDALSDETDGEPPTRVRFRFAHSNDVAEVGFADGRTLMVKRGRHDWAADRFATARIASRLLRRHTRVEAPAPLTLPEDIDDAPLQVYWRIDLPTLEELWPRLDRAQRLDALRSWGALMRRIHHVRLPGNGPLHKAVEEPVPLREFLWDDLEQRLYPAILGEWPDAAPLLERTLELLPAALRAADETGGRLVHHDMHMGNVLCRPEAGRVHCVGVLDLEAAVGTAPEADLASVEVLHGPLFEMQIDPPPREPLRRGYGRPVDPALMSLFRVNHLLNLGFYSALVGHHWHAGQVGGALEREVRVLAGRTGREP